MVSVVLAGGGTAGHTSPLIATAEALRALDQTVRITCIGTARGLETRVIPEAGLDLQLVPAVLLPRKPSVDLLKVPFRWRGDRRRQTHPALGGRRRRLRVRRLRGHARLPGRSSTQDPGGHPEQNALPGLANKVAARFASAVLTSFPDTPLPGARFEGLPVRRAISELASRGRTAGREELRTGFGLAADLPVLLVSGGSQGARSLNNAAVDAADRLLAAGIQVLHVWGPKNFHDGLTERIDEQTGARYVPVGYVDQMSDAYTAADLMLARSGAGTVVETAVVGLPTILVPLPIGNGEHARNARPLVDAGAAVLIDDADLDADRLVREVTGHLTDPERMASMSRAAQDLMKPGAADRVANAVLAAAAGRRRAGGA